MDDQRIYVIAEALRKGVDCDTINKITNIDKWFIDKIAVLVEMEQALKEGPLTVPLLQEAKRMEFPDRVIGVLTGLPEESVKKMRYENGITAAFKMVDTCADIDDILHILRRQRFKIEFICDIKIRTYCFRVIVYNDCLISRFCKSPCSMYGAIIELDTLPDTDRAGTKHKHRKMRDSKAGRRNGIYGARGEKGSQSVGISGVGASFLCPWRTGDADSHFRRGSGRIYGNYQPDSPGSSHSCG